MDRSILSMLSALAPLGATEFYIGLSSDAFGQFSYVNGKDHHVHFVEW